MDDRRMMRRILQVHKMVDGKTPLYLREKLPQMQTRYSRFFPQIKIRNQFPVMHGTERYLNSFFPDAMKSWNNVITDFKELPTFEKLKKHLISLYRPNIRSTFDIHNPQLRYIFQLRVGLSHLLHHKKSHHFTDTPSDKCLCKKGVEDTKHFLITCPFYTTHRNVLFAKVENILQSHNLTVTNFSELLLYGHPSLNESENRIIILATLEFINKTQRFSK